MRLSMISIARFSVRRYSLFVNGLNSQRALLMLTRCFCFGVLILGMVYSFFRLFNDVLSCQLGKREVSTVVTAFLK